MDKIVDALTSINLWIAVFKSISIIMLGFILAKLKILNDEFSKVLNKIVLTISIPCLAFTSFMKDVSIISFKSAIFSFFYGFIIYTLLIVITKFMFKKENKNKKTVLEVLLVFGSTTFFSQPLINACFSSAINDSNMFNISYRIFLYSYAFILISGIKFDKSNLKRSIKQVFLNPIIILTLLGFLLWSLQLFLKDIPFYRIDKTFKPLYSTMENLASLASPLVWLSIGITLSKVNIIDVGKDKMVWIYSIIKVLFIPLINLIILFVINMFFKVDFNVFASSVLMLASPTATVAVSYCINFDKEKVFASNCSFVSTLVAVLFIPFWITVINLVEVIL